MYFAEQAFQRLWSISNDCKYSILRHDLVFNELLVPLCYRTVTMETDGDPCLSVSGLTL